MRRNLLLLVPLLLAGAARADEPGYNCLIEPFREIKLATPSSGVIERVLVDRGDTVAEGQLVAKLNSSLEDAELASARIKAKDDSNLQARIAKRQLAESRLSRLRGLTGEARFVSQANLEQGEADALTARADVLQAQTDLQLAAVDVQHAEAKLALRFITSPVTGLVTKRDLSEGEYGYEQQPVLTLAQLDPLNVELFLPVSSYGELHVGDSMTVEPQEPVGGAYLGQVTVIDRNLDSRSSTYGVRVSLPNPKLALPAGIRCKARRTPGN